MRFHSKGRGVMAQSTAQIRGESGAVTVTKRVA
jgi:hypothetical protein